MKGRKLLMIPGPIEFEPDVLQALGQATTSHVAADFVEVFGRALERMREVFLCPSGQPFVVAGSGTLAMDMAAANLVEPGDRALVINTGYFGDRYAAILERYGAQVTQVRAPIGSAPTGDQVEAALKSASFKLLTVTHVDTSTGVLTDVQAIAALARRYGALSIVDGVCATAGEECRQEEWGIDICFTASQKAIGAPPGLALLVASPGALAAWRARKTPVQSYYADFANWLPIMEAYEARQASYFGTPAVNLICALDVSLGHILAEGLEARFRRHRRIARACRAGIAALGLAQVAEPPAAAHTMTAPYYPQGVGAEVLKAILEAGAILAGGLHPEIKARYFRIGHMGSVSDGDLLATLAAVERGLATLGYRFEHGAGVAAAQRELLKERSV
jgi:alanine-glyoxylate transaminase/serine-glyoxylate transaminase/serine-pyruvate transaminase